MRAPTAQRKPSVSKVVLPAYDKTMHKTMITKCDADVGGLKVLQISVGQLAGIYRGIGQICKKTLDEHQACLARVC